MLYFNEENILNEVYFGKTKDIQELQDIFSKYRNDVLKNDTNIKKTANISKYLFEFNRKIEDIFGFDGFSLSIIYNPNVNAFTIPISTSFDIWNEKKYFKPSTTSFKFDKSSKYCCCIFIYEGLFFDKKYTNEEMLAIILHEIGHNFQNVLNPKSFVFNSIIKSAQIIEIILLAIRNMNPAILSNILSNFNFIKRMDILIEKYMKKNFKGIIQTKDFISYFISEVIQIFAGLSFITNPIGNILSSVLAAASKYNPISLINMYFGYNNEKIADDFVATYGYSKELSSALNKLSYTKAVRTDTTINSLNSITNIFRDLLFCPATILATPVDEHPKTINRSLELIEYLQNELNDNVKDSKMKNRIKIEINNVKKELNKVLEIEDKETDAAIKAYDVYMYKKYGKGLKEKLFKVNNSKIINTSYQTALSKTKLL